MLSLFVSAVQGLLAWRPLNRGFHANLLQTRTVECTNVVKLIQDFSSRDAENRLMVGLAENRMPSNLSINQIGPNPSEESVATKRAERVDLAQKSAEQTNTALYVIDRPMKAYLQNNFAFTVKSHSTKKEKLGSYGSLIAENLRRVMNRCYEYVSRYASFFE
jgi:hypothetical protein